MVDKLRRRKLRKASDSASAREFAGVRGQLGKTGIYKGAARKKES
jgi:hypothetical protein